MLRMGLCAVVAVGVLALRGAAAPDNHKKTQFVPGKRPPAKTLFLFTGRPEQLRDNWVERYTANPPGWTVDKAGVATPNKHDIATRREFGDCMVHVEFRCPPEGHGNSGVGLQGRYEVQILNSFGQAPEEHGCGALYSQKPPLVNASKRPGEWQTFDIRFRAPRFDANGHVTEQARATVYQNGALVQDDAEFNGPTGIQYGQYKEQAPTGPLILQGDHDPVQFRNVWIVPE